MQRPRRWHLTSASSETLILARTDVTAVEELDAALDRAQAYLDCGVDAPFIEALRSPEQMDAACQRFGQQVPMLANRVEGGKTPIQDADALHQYCFRTAIFPGGTARAVVHTPAGLLREPARTPHHAGMVPPDAGLR